MESFGNPSRINEMRVKKNYIGQWLARSYVTDKHTDRHIASYFYIRINGLFEIVGKLVKK